VGFIYNLLSFGLPLMRTGAMAAAPCSVTLLVSRHANIKVSSMGSPRPIDFANRMRLRSVMASFRERSMYFNYLKRSCSTREASATMPLSPIFMAVKDRWVKKVRVAFDKALAKATAPTSVTPESEKYKLFQGWKPVL